MDFDEIIAKTTTLNNKFPNKFDKRDRFIDLIEEAGELAQAIQIHDKRKFTNNPSKQKTIEDVADALCDVMYDIILLSRDYEVSLEQEYLIMLDRLEERLKKGEFNNE